MKTKHSYKITTIIWGFVLACFIADLAWTILHPRPTRFLWLVVLLYFAVKISRERDPEKCIWRRDYKRQKEQAEEAGIAYNESRRVVKTPKMYIIEIPLILGLIYIFLYFPNAMWSYHASWEYAGEIAWYKNTAERLKQEYGDYETYDEVYERYRIFPDAIPREAKCVKWRVLPGMLQGTGYIYLSMKMPAEYIQDTINRYASAAKILNCNEEVLECYDEEGEEILDTYWGWWNEEYSIGRDSFPGIDREDKQAENVVVYLLSDDCGVDSAGYGFWVNKKENVICFFES